jgi:RES domain-containing protein
VSTTTAWRIVKAVRVSDALTGEGARRAGGRWNYPGTAMVYTAGSLALAALEVLVHLDGPQLLQSYVQIPVEFTERLCRRLDLDSLPEDWADNPAPESTKRIGTEWIDAHASVVLGVPSAVVPDEFVYLINPRHSDFPDLRIGQPASFRFDPRLVRNLP